MIESPYLFVYGTLRGGANSPWSSYLKEVAAFVGFGRCRGLLFQLGGYPGMTTSDVQEVWVRGEVFLPSSRSAWDALDAYEGCGHDAPPPHEFERRVLSVTLDDGKTVDAWVYLYQLSTRGRTQISSGDFLSE